MVLWVFFVIILPYFGVFIYLIVEHKGIAERSAKQMKVEQAATDDYIRSVASSSGGAAAEIERAKHLLDSGTITQAEFDSIKAKALAAT